MWVARGRCDPGASGGKGAIGRIGGYRSDWTLNASQRGEGARGETNGGFSPSNNLQ